MHAEAMYIGVDAHLLTVAPHDFLVDRSGVELSGISAQDRTLQIQFRVGIGP